MRSEDRFTVPGRTRAAVERDLLALGAEPDADWSGYHLASVTTGGESVPLRADVRLTEAGGDVVVDAVYRHGRVLAWRRAWFRLTVYDARRLLRAALHAPAEVPDEAGRTAAAQETVVAIDRLERRTFRVRLVLGIVGLVVSIASVSIHAHARPKPPPTPRYELDSNVLTVRLEMEYGLPETVCNGNHLLHIDHTGQVFTCVAGPTTYDVTVVDLDPLEFGVTVPDP